MNEPAGIRIGDGERAAVVEALAAHREAGRLTPTEFEERQVAASRALTWAEVGPLFHDLPQPHPVGMPTGLVAVSPPLGAVGIPAPTAGGQAVGLPGEPSSGPLDSFAPPRVRETVMALVPFLALFLFFRTGQWLWFLAIPVVGILLFRPDGGKTKRRRR